MIDSIQAFNDVEAKPFPKDEGLVNGENYLDNVSAMQIGFGSKVLRADESGIWLGAKEFADAPFSVDMLGNVIATTLSLSNYLSKTDTAQALSGSINVGAGNVLIDGVNKRILINDGTTNRILIGFQSGGF